MENNNSQQQYGVINEIGDLGLGFNAVTESEQEKLNKEKEKNK